MMKRTPLLPVISRLNDGVCLCLLKDGITRCSNTIHRVDPVTRPAARLGLCMMHWRVYIDGGLDFPRAPEWWLWPETLKTRLIDLVRRSGVDDAEILIQNLEKRIR